MVSQDTSPNESLKTAPILNAHLVLGEIVLALALTELLSSVKLDPFDPPSLVNSAALIVLVVWVAQLLAAWTRAFEVVDANKLLFRGIPQLWLMVAFIGLVYWACHNQDNLPTLLFLLGALLIVDFVWSVVGVVSPGSNELRDVNRRWVKRDLAMAPLIFVLWGVYLWVDKSPKLPELATAVILLIIVVFGYTLDMRGNFSFYWGLPKRN